MNYIDGFVAAVPTANREAYSLLADAGVPIIEKPFAPTLLLDAIRRVATSLTPSS